MNSHAFGVNPARSDEGSIKVLFKQSFKQPGGICLLQAEFDRRIRSAEGA